MIVCVFVSKLNLM